MNTDARASGNEALACTRELTQRRLLIAVLAVGIDPLTATGPWEKINTTVAVVAVVAVVAGVVLAAFTWPRKTRLQDESSQMPQADSWIIAAQAIVYGLIITIGTGWPIQFLLNPPDCPAHSADVILLSCAEADRISDVGTYWALGIGGLATIILFLSLRRVVKRP